MSLLRIVPHPSTHTRSFSTATVTLSGHNRWSKIRHRKGAADQQRGSLFSKLSSEIITAMRPPLSADPTLNSRLATALQRAKEQGLTKAGIENAMSRARAVADGSGQTIVYEAVALSGKAALMIECVSQNPTKLVKRVKEILSKNSARTSPVAFLFDRKGSITLRPSGNGSASFDHLFDIAVEAGAEDVVQAESDDGGIEYEVITSAATLSPLTQLLSDNPAYSLQSSDLIYVPKDPVKVTEQGDAEGGVSEEVAERLIKIVDMLEEEMEVVKVWTNLDE